MLIGGAEDKTGARVVLQRFVRLAGGADARVAVVATASSLGQEAVDLYHEAFGRLGVKDVRGPLPTTRAEAADPDLVAQLADVTGVFLTGGNQMTLTGALAATPFGDAILAAHRRGAVVGGTSAGASGQSEHMMAFGAEGATPKLRMAQMTAGLGLLHGVVVDQHFDQRNRYGRLLSLVAHAPHLLGIGVDEDTAAVVTDLRWLEVVGRGAVTLFDGRGVTSNADTARRSAPLLVSGAVVHSLPSGARFDLQDRVLLPTASGRPDDLRPPAPPAAPVTGGRLARRVAAEGVGTGKISRAARRTTGGGTTA